MKPVQNSCKKYGTAETVGVENAGNTLYSTGLLHKLPCVCLISMSYALCFMFYMCSSAKIIYCYLRAAVISVVLHLAVLVKNSVT